MAATRGRLESRIHVPEGGWEGTINDSGAGAAVTFTIPEANYYITEFLSELEDQLNTAAPTDTITVTISMGESGTHKVTITSSGNGTLTWTDTDLRDLLGYTGTLTLVAATGNTATNKCRAVWLPDCIYRAPNAINPWVGAIETDSRSVETPGGKVYSLGGQYKFCTWLEWTAVSRARSSQANESTTNESFERFLRDGVWGHASWGRPGGPVRFFPDAADTEWIEYAVNVSQTREFRPAPLVPELVGGPWLCRLERLVYQDAGDINEARAALAAANLTTNSDTTAGTSFATASISPTANRLVLAGVVSHNTTTLASPTLTGNGLTWVSVAAVNLGSARRLSVFRAMGSSPSAGAVTIDFGAVSQTACCWSIVQLTNPNTSGTNGSGAIVQSDTNSAVTVTTINTTLASLENAANAMVVFVGLSVETGVTPDAQFTELGDDGEVGNAIGIESEWALNQTTCDPTFSSATAGIIGIEVKAAVA